MKRKPPVTSGERIPQAYKGYLIDKTLTGSIFIEKDGFLIGWANSLEHAKATIDSLTKNPQHKAAKHNSTEGGGGMKTFNIPSLREIKAVSLGSTYNRGEMLAQFTTKERAQYGADHLLRLGFSVDIPYKSSTTKYWTLLFRIPTQQKNPQHKAAKHNPPTQIYGRVLQIKAQKLSGPFKGQRFYHDFKAGAIAYGLPNGDILISSRRR